MSGPPVVHVGVPMWADRRWVGRYLPADTRSGTELAAYSRILDAVEGNTTFYASPAPTTVAKWLAMTPSTFRFVFKVPRTVTHDRRLRDADTELGAFVDLMAPLSSRIGGLTIQLPASFGPNDLGALTSFVGSLPAGWRWSVEVRHPAFFGRAAGEALDRVLEHHGIERVILDSRTLFAEPPTSEVERITWGQKPKLPVVVQALTDHPIVRYIGRDDPERTSSGWGPWIPIVARWLAEGRTPTFFVHTPDNLSSPALARAFHLAVAEAVPGLRALPDPRPIDPSPPDHGGAVDQPSLF